MIHISFSTSAAERPVYRSMPLHPTVGIFRGTVEFALQRVENVPPWAFAPLSLISCYSAGFYYCGLMPSSTFNLQVDEALSTPMFHVIQVIESGRLEV